MKRLLLLIALCPAMVFGQGCPNFGNGSNGALHVTADSSIIGGEYQFTSFNIPAGVTLSVIGSNPLQIRCTGSVSISGILQANGGNGNDGITYISGGNGGIGVAGGGNGGNGSFSSGSGPINGTDGSYTGAGGMGAGWSGGGGAGHANSGASSGGVGGFGGPNFGANTLPGFEPGAGGGGGSGGYDCGAGGGGAGGGYISIFAPDVTIGATGMVSCKGGNGGSDGTGNCGGGGAGSGGAIWISGQNVIISGSINVSGGIGGASMISGNPYYGTGGNGSDGRVRIDYNNLTNTGTVLPSIGYSQTPVVFFTTSIISTTEPCGTEASGEIALSSSGGTTPYTYLWSDGSSNAILTGVPAGSYSCIVTDNNGCITNVDVTLNSLAVDSISQNISICSGEIYTIGSSTYTTSGIYYDNFQNTNGCDSVVTTNLTVEATINNGATINGHTLTATQSGAQYQWVDCNNGFAAVGGATAQNFSPAADGSYAVIVTVNGCSDTSACLTYSTIGIEESANFVSSVYPNPTTGIITVQLHIAVSSMTVTDVTGRIVREHAEQSASAVTIDLNKEANGVYFLNIIVDERVQTLRIVKE